MKFGDFGIWRMQNYSAIFVNFGRGPVTQYATCTIPVTARPSCLSLRAVARYTSRLESRLQQMWLHSIVS